MGAEPSPVHDASMRRLATLLWCTVAVLAAFAVASMPHFIDTAYVVLSLFAVLTFFAVLLARVEYQRWRSR